MGSEFEYEFEDHFFSLMPSSFLNEVPVPFIHAFLPGGTAFLSLGTALSALVEALLSSVCSITAAEFDRFGSGGQAK